MVVDGISSAFYRKPLVAWPGRDIMAAGSGIGMGAEVSNNSIRLAGPAPYWLAHRRWVCVAGRHQPAPQVTFQTLQQQSFSLTQWAWQGGAGEFLGYQLPKLHPRKCRPWPTPAQISPPWF